MTDVPLAILEVSAILLTLLFIAIQYISRHIDDRSVPAETLTKISGLISITALSVGAASFFSAGEVANAVDSGPTEMAAIALTIALLLMALAIRSTANDISELVDTDTTGRINTEKGQSTLGEFENE